MGRINHIVGALGDFFLCLYFFPEGIRIVKFLSVPGLHAISEKFFLYLVAKNISAGGDVLEIGSYMGGSSVLLAEGNRLSKNKGRVWLIEPNPLPDQVAFLEVFKSRSLDNITLIGGKSDETVGDVDARFRFIFIDGDHEYEHVKNDILHWGARLADGGVMAFHNISYEGVERAVNDFVRSSCEYVVLGMLADTLYASRGECRDKRLFERFIRLNAVRERARKIAKDILISS